MARYALAAPKTTGAAAGFITQLRAGASRDLRVYEIGCFTASAVSGTVGLIRPSAVGATFTSVGPGAAEDAAVGAGLAVVDTAITTVPTIGTVFMRRVVLPASIGAGIIWTFPLGINVPVNGGLDLHQISAAAVSYETYFVYEE